MMTVTRSQVSSQPSSPSDLSKLTAVISSAPVVATHRVVPTLKVAAVATTLAALLQPAQGQGFTTGLAIGTLLDDDDTNGDSGPISQGSIIAIAVIGGVLGTLIAGLAFAICMPDTASAISRGMRRGASAVYQGLKCGCMRRASTAPTVPAADVEMGYAAR